MSQRVLVTGATGFVGRYVVRQLHEDNFYVKILVRKDSDRTPIEGAYDEAAIGDVKDAPSLRKACENVDAVVHVVGIRKEAKGQKFDEVVVEGTRRLVEAARASGTVKKFVLQSALGTGPDANNDYHRTKYEAEQIVSRSGIPYTIFRPSFILGKDAGLLKEFENLLKMPLLPLPGGFKTRAQPVYVKDLAHMFSLALREKHTDGNTYEVGGPDICTMKDLLEHVKEKKGYKFRLMPSVPIPLLQPGAYLMDLVLPNPPVTPTELKMMKAANTLPAGALERLEKDFGLKLTPLQEQLARSLNNVKKK